MRSSKTSTPIRLDSRPSARSGIINTHWRLEKSGGFNEIRQVRLHWRRDLGHCRTDPAFLARRHHRTPLSATSRLSTVLLRVYRGGDSVADCLHRDWIESAAIPDVHDPGDDREIRVRVAIVSVLWPVAHPSARCSTGDS